MTREAIQDALALVPAGGIFEGEIALLGPTRIEGTVQGTIRGPGKLIIQPGAYVEGAVDCEALDCHGRIRGSVIARDHVRLGAGSELEGDLDTDALLMDPESVWNGAARIGR